MHHAIKLVKLKKLVKVHGVTDHDLLSTLQIEDWDVAKAASYTQYGPIKNGRIKNQGSDFEKK